MKSKHVITYLVCLTITTQLFGQNKINWEEDLIYMRSYLEIMHPHLYDFVTQEEFNEDYDYLMNNWQKLDDAEIVTWINEIFAQIQDGHTGCGFLYKKNEYIRGLFHYYPLWLYKFSNGVYVLYAKKEYKELVGKKILRIGNLPIDKAVKQLMRMNIGDNDWGKSQQFYLIQEFLQYTGILNKNESELKLLYEKDGETLSYVLNGPESVEDYYMAPKVFPQKDSAIVTMNDDCIKPLPLYLSNLYNEDGYSGNNYWYKYLPEKETFYLQINNNMDKENDPFEEFCKRMFKSLDSLKAKKFIVDVRLNGGGNHFEMPLIKGIIARPDIDTKGKLFLLTSRRTISASEHLTTQMETYTNVVIVGEPTAARPNMVGSIAQFDLPNSGLRCFTAKEYTQDSNYEDFRLTTKPQIYALLSSEDYANNNDPVLDAVFIYDSIVKIKEDCRLAMQDGYMKGGIDGLTSAFYKHKQGCKRVGVNFEYFFIDEFSWWIYSNRKEKQDYSQYIKFVVDEIPESMRANYWYARNCQLRDKNDLAKEYYMKCLNINPAHENALKYLKLIELNKKYKVVNYGW